MSMQILESLLADLKKLKNPQKAKVLARFFKTGKGEYGEGDVFWGIIVPKQRIVARRYIEKISFADLRYLLKQKVHELRFLAVVILVLKYQRGELGEKMRVADFYLQNLNRINNWDLVDLSAPQILGDYLFEKDRTILYRLASSRNLWERRISIISTLGFIRNRDFYDTLKIAKILLLDRHDLIHKAVGWMLREIGKREKKEEVNFLHKYAKKMPRTALRYAIEKFSKEEREIYLKMC
jgi:3-methyladenine DNA glycosylase AlkD